MNNLLAGIPEEHMKFVQLPNEQGHNAVWDFQRSPDGRFYVSVCGENEKPLTALLYEYDPKTGDLRLICDVEKAWIIDREEMPPSKIHTSIDFLPDGRLIMATHNTAPAPGHKQWMYEQHYEHPWEGFPGSILMIVNPDTNEVQVRGIPVPRESIYGGMLGNDPRYYYFLGYMRGHFYRLDLETNEVKDYGKVTEFSSCRLVKDAKGRLYSSTYTGEIWRYDPELDEIVDLKVRFVSPNGTKYRRQFIFALHSPRDTLFMVDNVDGEMIELHPETLETTRHGHIHLPEQQPVKPYGIGGLAADENFVLYYGLKTFDEYCPIRLVRWDILNGGKPENLGLITPGGKDSQYICEMIFDENGRLHMVDVCGEFSPYILAVDVNKLQPPGSDTPNAIIRPYTEPDYNGVGSPAYMHIAANKTSVLPLHQHMKWRDSAIRHMHATSDAVFIVSGHDCVFVTEAAYTDDKPVRMEIVYSSGAPQSCVDVDERTIAVLTTDNRIVLVDTAVRRCEIVMEMAEGIELSRLHCSLKQGKLLASDCEGAIFVCDFADGSRPRKLENIRLASSDAHLLRFDERRILLSGESDEIVLYDAAAMQAETLTVKASAVRGRAFRATITGSTVLSDGTIVAGTQDGMLFTLTPDLRRTTGYGRLYSSGQLRGFVTPNGSDVLGIYGGAREAGHVFHFSRDLGLVDLGRPRVIKDNQELRDIDSEWASIHYISCLAYSSEDDWLCVASGEEYGCAVRYRGVAFPK